MKVGDRVKITETSEYWQYDSPDNPRDIQGVIVNVDEERPRGPDTHFIEVAWDNGRENSYRATDLELVTPKYYTTEVIVKYGKSRLTEEQSKKFLPKLVPLKIIHRRGNLSLCETTVNGKTKRVLIKKVKKQKDEKWYSDFLDAVVRGDEPRFYTGTRGRRRRPQLRFTRAQVEDVLGSF